MYLSSILQFLSWPLFILISYYVIRFVVKRAEQKHPPVED
jgi:hypothetical protein